VIAAVLWVALAAQAPGDAAAELARLQAAVAQRPDDGAAHFALGRSLAMTYADPAAIGYLRRAMSLGLPTGQADEARMWIPFLLFESGKDREAADACAELLKSWPQDHSRRPYVQGLIGDIARRHAALERVTGSETRATILIVAALVFLVLGFWGGRRCARRREARA